MEDNIFDSLKEFIYQQRWKYKFPLERSTSLENDLLISGLDAEKLMVEYGKTFNVDLSRFMFSDYFNLEGYSFRIFSRRAKKIKELTLGDLEKGIIAKRLDEETIENKS